MQIKIIGGHGGVTKNYQATSYLIDESLLIDAGSVASGLDIEDQLKIEHILISHSHLDHIKDLAFICDNCFGLKKVPFEVYSDVNVHHSIKKHIFNETIWPDFSKLPSVENPTIRFNNLENKKSIELGKYKVTPVHVNHPGGAMGFIVEKDETAILFTLDTKATDEIWEVAKSIKNLKAIFTEVSFPNSLQKIADLSDHHTPQTIKAELLKMPKDIPVYLGHLKPNFQEQLIKEVSELGESRLHPLYADDVRFTF